MPAVSPYPNANSSVAAAGAAMMGAPRASAEAVALASGAEPVCRKCVWSEMHAAMFACVRGVCLVVEEAEYRVIGSTEFVRLYDPRCLGSIVFCLVEANCEVSK